jgi:hypothetical protein
MKEALCTLAGLDPSATKAELLSKGEAVSVEVTKVRHPPTSVFVFAASPPPLIQPTFHSPSNTQIANKAREAIRHVRGSNPGSSASSSSSTSSLSR